MDSSHLIDPISDRVPSAAAIVSTVADLTTGLADQLTDHVGDIDLAETVRRTQRTLARVVPWMPTPGRRRWTSRPWLLAGVAAVAVIAVVFVVRRRSTDGPPTRPNRDDWSSPSVNGAMPSAAEQRSERESADTNA